MSEATVRDNLYLYGKIAKINNKRVLRTVLVTVRYFFVHKSFRPDEPVLTLVEKKPLGIFIFKKNLFLPCPFRLFFCI